MTQKEIDKKLLQHETWLKEHASFSADFSYEDLSGIDFTGKDLRYVKFEFAKLDNVNFTNANLKDARFYKASINGVKWPKELEFEPMPELINLVAKRALENDNSLDMFTWHGPYNKSHCIGGWGVFIHPEGSRMEKASSTYLAARLLLGEEVASHFNNTTQEAKEFLRKFL